MSDRKHGLSPQHTLISADNLSGRYHIRSAPPDPVWWTWVMHTASRFRALYPLDPKAWHACSFQKSTIPWKVGRPLQMKSFWRCCCWAKQKRNDSVAWCWISVPPCKSGSRWLKVVRVFAQIALHHEASGAKVPSEIFKVLSPWTGECNWKARSACRQVWFWSCSRYLLWIRSCIDSPLPFLGSQFTVLFHVFELIRVVMQAPAQVSCSKIHQKIC